jgi:hypothetical protein
MRPGQDVTLAWSPDDTFAVAVGAAGSDSFDEAEDLPAAAIA